MDSHAVQSSLVWRNHRASVQTCVTKHVYFQSSIAYMSRSSLHPPSVSLVDLVYYERKVTSSWSDVAYDYQQVADQVSTDSRSIVKRRHLTFFVVCPMFYTVFNTPIETVFLFSVFIGHRPIYDACRSVALSIYTSTKLCAWRYRPTSTENAATIAMSAIAEFLASVYTDVISSRCVELR